MKLQMSLRIVIEQNKAKYRATLRYITMSYLFNKENLYSLVQCSYFFLHEFLSKHFACFFLLFSLNESCFTRHIC